MASKKHFVRLDSKNQPVIGSNIARPNKPVSGRWLRIFPPNCCNDELRYTPLDVTSATGIDFELTCDGAAIVTVRAMGATADIAAVATLLTETLGVLFTFAVDGTDLVATANLEAVSSLCNGQLAFTAEAV